MKKILLISFLLSTIFLTGCSDGNKATWQGAYYDKGIEDSNIVYGPIFTNYKGCKDWAISKKSDAYNNYAYCAKNCHDSVDGTPICEEVIRTWKPLPGSITFDNYEE